MARAWPRVVYDGIRIWNVTSREPVAFWPSELMFPATWPSARTASTWREQVTGASRRSGTRRQVESSRPSRDTPESSTRSHSARTARGWPPGGADGTVRLWDIARSGDAAAISLPDSEMHWWAADLSPDGRSLLAFPRRSVELWDTATRRMRGSPIERRAVDSRPNWRRRRRTHVPGGP